MDLREGTKRGRSTGSINSSPEQTPETQGSGRRYRCSDCGQHAAIRSCLCVFPPRVYCPPCSHLHLEQQVPNLHLLIPSSAAENLLSESQIPAFIARDVFTSHVCDVLRYNLTLVERAKEAIDSECKRLHREVTAYFEGKLRELEEMETELRLRVESALRGIEEVRYLPVFPPKNEVERLISEEWRGSVEGLQTRLSLFVSSVTVEHLVQGLQTAAHFYANFSVLYPPSSNHSSTSLPVVSCESLKSLWLPSQTWTNSPFPSRLCSQSAITFLPSGDLFLCGGKQTNSAFLIDGLTQTVTSVSSMRLARGCHGLLSVPDFVFAFGGRAESDLRECERFVLKTNHWQDIRQMHKPRALITPCRLYLKIFIAGGHADSFETFNLITENFDLLGLSSIPLTSTICLALESSILIIAKQGMLEIDSGYKAISRLGTVPGGDWWSATSPVSFNGCLYFCRYGQRSAPSLYRLDLTSKRLEEVS